MRCDTGGAPNKTSNRTKKKKKKKSKFNESPNYNFLAAVAAVAGVHTTNENE